MKTINIEDVFYGITISTENKPVSTKYPVPPYKQAKMLETFLDTNQSPFTAENLREVGLEELVEKIPKHQDSVIAVDSWPTLNDNVIVDPFILRQRLRDFQFHLFAQNKPQNCIYTSPYKSIVEAQMDNFLRKIDSYSNLIISIEEITNGKPYFSLDKCDLHDNISSLRTVIRFDGRILANIFTELRSNVLTLHKMNSLYDLPPWQITTNDRNNSYDLSCNSKQINKTNTTIKDIINCLFSQPTTFEKDRVYIIETFKTIFKRKILPTDIIFDPVRNCYCLSPSIEKNLLSNFIPLSSKCDELVKYTSFSTLIKTLSSRKIRMSSMVNMNDKTEMTYLAEITKNFTEKIEHEGDEYFFANQNFITSFSERKDDLDMWRFYGDNAHGICMVFDAKNVIGSGIKKILYIDKGEKIVQNIQKFLFALTNNHIKFRFSILDNNKSFYKSKDFESEAEHRLLINVKNVTNWTITQPYNIFAPYIEKNLNPSNNNIGDNFPLTLKSIILGPEMQNKNINKFQIRQFILNHCFSSKIEIIESKISNYRN